MILAKTDGEGLDAAAKILVSGGVALIPTDTVYGLAAMPGDADAIDRIYTIKSREPKKPIALLASGEDAIRKAGFALEGEAARLAKLNWPGALTLVLRNADGKEEAFRVPDHEWTRSLLAACGGLLKVTSANISGEKAPGKFKEALDAVGGKTDVAVDGGNARLGVASAVVRADGKGGIELLRPNRALRLA